MCHVRSFKLRADLLGEKKDWGDLEPEMSDGHGLPLCPRSRRGFHFRNTFEVLGYLLHETNTVHFECSLHDELS